MIQSKLQGKKVFVKLARLYGTPLYVYDKSVILNSYRQIVNSIQYLPKQIHYACMANGNIEILKIIRKLGMGIHVCSLGELFLAIKAGFKSNQIVFTGSNLSIEELILIAKKKVQINLDSLSQVQKYGNLMPGSEIGIRINPNVRLPLKDIMNWAVGAHSRLGIGEENINDVKKLAGKYGLKIVGLQMYIGTNILDYRYFLRCIDFLLNIGKDFKYLKYVDIGGGFGIPYKSNEKPFDWKSFGLKISEAMNRFSNKMGRRVLLKLEPGRSIIGNAGILLTKVIDIKYSKNNIFIGTDTSLSNFARPYIYDSYHEIIPLTVHGKQALLPHVYVCGNTVASKDFIGKDRRMPMIKEGDILAIMNTGAYGYSMSSHFCGRVRPAEVLLEGERPILIRKRESLEDLLN